MSVRLKPIFIDLKTMLMMVTISEATIRTMINRKEFPAPKKMSDRRVGWLLREVEEWAESRPVSDLPPPPNTGARKPQRSNKNAG